MPNFDIVITKPALRSKATVDLTFPTDIGIWVFFFLGRCALFISLRRVWNKKITDFWNKESDDCFHGRELKSSDNIHVEGLIRIIDIEGQEQNIAIYIMGFFPLSCYIFNQGTNASVNIYTKLQERKLKLFCPHGECSQNTTQYTLGLALPRKWSTLFSFSLD